MQGEQYRITEENAMAFDYPHVSTSVHFWMPKDAIVFPDDEREPQNGFVPVIIRAEYQVWMSSSVLVPVATP